MKIRLQLGLATTFTLLTTLLLGVVIGFLYFGNRDLALRTAESEMVEARERSVERMLSSIRAASRAVTSAASFAGEFPEDARTLDGLDVLHALARGNDHYYGLYFGVSANGAFYQNVLLSDEITSFGPEDTPVPEYATRALRIIDGPPEARTETFYWATDNGTAEAFSQRTPSYDPRIRPWFEGAIETEDIYVTPLYRFESTGEPGVTFAQRIEDHTGTIIGVAGLDMTLAALSNILEDLRIGEDGLVYMLDIDGQLISYTGSRSGGEGTRFVTSSEEQGIETLSPIIDSAVMHYRDDGAAFFRFSSPAADGQGSTVHLASVAEIPRIFGAQSMLGLTVPEDEFVGEINRTTTRALQIGALAVVAVVASTLIVSRLLGSSLRLVSEEARRISNFELGDDLNLRSTIKEVSELETAMTSMKAGLSSFGAYVPKDLVRSIVSSGEQIGVGGTSRDVTLMFSDLQGFTASTESLEPEELMPALSQYFEAMETRIAETGGTVDKYIGDAIMAMWNAPLDDPDHAIHACRAALACLKAEEKMNEGPQASPLLPLHTRFGLHSGRVIVGNVGSLSRMQYTALGAVVNLASRLESLNKQYGTRVLVSEDVANETKGRFFFREIDVVSPVGTSQPVKLFELLGDAELGGAFPVSDAMRAEVTDWKACYALYQTRSWSDALNAFELHRKNASNKTLIDVYIGRCRGFLETPPPADWDGVYSFSVK